jgi:hypothetical protein
VPSQFAPAWGLLPEIREDTYAVKKKRTPMMNTPPDAMQGNYKIKHKEKDARNVLGRRNEDKYV